MARMEIKCKGVPGIDNVRYSCCKWHSLDEGPIPVPGLFDPRVSQEREKAREEGWNNTRHTKLKEYNALFDPNMRHFFETPSVQSHLLKTGQVRSAKYRAANDLMNNPFFSSFHPMRSVIWPYNN